MTKLIINSVKLIYELLTKTIKPSYQDYANHRWGTTEIVAGTTANVFTFTPGGRQEIFNFKWRIDDNANGTGVFFEILINDVVKQEWGIIEAVDDDLFNSEVSFVLDSSRTIALRCLNSGQSNIKVNYHYWSWSKKSIEEEIQ